MHPSGLFEQFLVTLGVEAVGLEGKPSTRDGGDTLDKARQFGKQIRIGHRNFLVASSQRNIAWRRDATPMKLILSRKGFDSAHGGYPSPILDGQLCPLPIPDDGSPTTYSKISPFNGSPIAQIVQDLTHGRIRPSDGAHLDPD